MKKTVLAAAFLLMVARHAPSGPVARGASIPEIRGTLSVSGAWALYPLALRWAEEFGHLHPGVRIDVQAGGAGKGMTDVLAGAVDIGMVSREIHPSELGRGAVAVAVAKDAVVPTVSRKNPLLAELRRRGLKREEFARIWISGTLKSWNTLLDGRAEVPIRVYTRSDACGAADTWAAYLGKSQEDLAGVGVYGDPGVAEAVKRDPFGIGYNNVNFAYDARTKNPVDGLEVCPIDLNGDGRIDPEESFYGTRDDLIRAVAANVYPSPPARDLYFVVKAAPWSPLLAEFLKWALTGGQACVAEMGYLPLGPERVAGGLALIEGSGKDVK
jgi:phosphate transport system substrate-binding protein